MSNSIDRNTEDGKIQDLQGAQAVERIRSVVKETQTCFFCTRVGGGASDGVRPMSVQRVDANGDVWFLSAVDSHKNVELSRDDAVTLLFQGTEHSDFLALTGPATVTQERDVIRGLWTPLARTWFTGGVDDPRISAICVHPRTGYYWDNQHGNVVAGIKMLVGAALGKTFDDSIQGRVQP